MALVMAQATVPVWPKWAMPGDAGHGEADDVELRAGQVDLLVDAGVLDDTVRVTPAMIACPVVVRSPLTSQPLLPAVPGPSAAKRATASGPRCAVMCSRQSLAGKPAKRMCVASQTPSGVQLPAAGGETGACEPGAAPPFGQPLVHPVDVGPHPCVRLRVLLLQGGEAAAGGVREPGSPGEPVPGQGSGPEEGRGGALRAVPLDLQLPSTVTGGHPALGAGEFVRVVRAQVRDPLRRRGMSRRSPLCPYFPFRLGSPKSYVVAE